LKCIAIKVVNGERVSICDKDVNPRSLMSLCSTHLKEYHLKEDGYTDLLKENK